MMNQETHPPPPPAREERESERRELAPALVLAWSEAEPERIGEAILVPGPARAGELPTVFGRFDPATAYHASRFAQPVRQRPGGNAPASPLCLPPYISRQQVTLEAGVAGGIAARNLGKGALWVNGDRPLRHGESVLLQAGDTLRLADAVLLLCVERPARLTPLRFYSAADLPAFGGADADGLVGESPALWRLRDRIAFAARLSQHVLLHGPSGSGKELVAHAVHRMSLRGRRRLVSHSAADIPATLIEAELFGVRQDYPNPGTPARDGLIGQADRSTLFLDEMGLLPAELQGKLLRVLDDGEYRRLGVDEALHADLRFITATNRPIEQLKADLLGRLKVVIEVPGLSERPEDIPLLVRHLLERLVEREPDGQLARRFALGGPDGTISFRLDITLLDALLRHQYTLHVREIEQLLLASLYSSAGTRLSLTDDVRRRLRFTSLRPPVAPEQMACELVEQALIDHRWNLIETARALGWSRFQLNRKMKRCGLTRGSAPS